MHVYILTFCRKPELLHGSTLVFKTLRTGFPTAEVTVVDNNSLPDARDTIAALARDSGCAFRPLEAHSSISPHAFLRQTIELAAAEAVVFLDPDVVFWESCEGWPVGGLAAGRLIPKFRDPYSGCITLPRLHPSFFWIPDTARLRARLADLKRRRMDFHPFLPYMYRAGADWYRFDTGAGLYAAADEGEMVGFGPRELNAYDHLFCGSHVDLVLDALEGADREQVVRMHDHAQHDHRRLKGIWKAQQAYWEERAVTG